MIVQVKQGKLEGIKETSVSTGKEYYSFLGIPYAQPPIGDLRFRPPVPLEKWDGVLEAKIEGSPCYQYSIMQNSERTGSEDCLYLNIYTPTTPSETKIPKPVMIFIHGGGFLFGSGARYTHSADYLINYDVILVTFNYRLHALGFLNMGVPSSPGNCGLKDQLMALKWIKENIAQFGGDFNNITIFGESAGASSVHWHLLSPLSKGLFNKAILQSGVTSCSWSLTSNPTENGFKLGQLLGFKGADPEKLVEFLKNQSVEDIAHGVHILQDNTRKELFGKATTLAFTPSVETIKDNAFIPDLPENLMKIAHPVPTIAGLNDKEGRLIFLVISITENLLRTVRENLIHIVKNNFTFHESQLEEVTNEVKKFYFSNEVSAVNTISGLVDLYSDIYFKDFYNTLDYIAKSTSPLYIYEFSFNGRFNTSMLRAPDHLKPLIAEGAAHGDDIPYLFYPRSLEKPQFQEPETTVIKHMCTFWTNFARTGNPNAENTNVEWKPSTTDNPCYLRINKELKLTDGRVLEKGIAFWKKLEEKFK